MSEMAAPSRPRVLVIMATYNGERYLREQIDSVLSQDEVDLSLLISDDCSSDGTLDIAREYEAIDKRVGVVSHEHNVGVGLNFMKPLYDADIEKLDYIAFSDQDDVWLPGKLIRAVNKIRSVEQSGVCVCHDDLGAPVLYCSDLQDVDAGLANPKRELVNLGIDSSKKATALMRNYYSGCTMVMNASMVRLLQEYPLAEFPRIHDAWCALVAQFCGNFYIDFESALILRRITGSNEVGEIHCGSDMENASVARIFKPSNSACTTCSRLLLEGYRQRMTNQNAATVGSFVSYRTSLKGRLVWALRSDYRASGFRDTFLMRVKLLFGRY